MKLFIFAFTTIVIFFYIAKMGAQSSDMHGKLSFISLTTVRDSDKAGEVQHFAPNVVVRFVKSDSKSISLAVTDQTGTALVVLEAGTYCTEAFGVDGRRAELNSRSKEESKRCFSIEPGKIIEFSLTLATNTKYGGKMPTLGVE